VKVTKNRKRETRINRGCKVLKDIDIYGQTVKLTYKGDEEFKTYPGAAISLIVCLVLLAFATYRCYVLIGKVNPTINKKGLLRDLDIEGPLKP
jgi:hypothetical protein